MRHPYICGCYFIRRIVVYPYIQHYYLPQVSVKAHATILQNTSRTTLTQTFVNTDDSKGIKEIRYAFPLFDGVSVVGFECRVGDRVIVGEVKEKDTARAEYKEAIASGETAGLLEQLPSAADVFTTTVGNIPPGATVVVNITYLGELKHDAEVDGIRFTIPATIAPRYGEYPGELYQANNVRTIAKGFEVVVDAMLEDGAFIREMRSPTHPIAVSMGTTSVHPDADPKMSRASATFSLGTAELDKDFVLQLVAKETAIPKALLERHPTIPNQRALMATLVPKFALKQQRPEIVFVCDRSGSMSGSNITVLSAALKVFLKSLPVGVKFNICSFGSHHDFLWPKSKTYDQASLEQAISHVSKFQANYGGTDILNPMKETLARRYKDMNLEVFLVTDGEIWDQEALFKLLNEEIQDKKQPIRVFTLGIGNGVSHALIEGAARAGNGFAQSVGSGEKLDSKVVRMLKAGLSPHITDFSLEVKYGNEKSTSDDDFDLVEKVIDSFNVKMDISDGGEPATTSRTTGLSDKIKKTISLFDTSADPDAEDKKPATKTGEARYSHVPKVPIPKFIQAPHQVPPLFAFSRTSVYLLLSPETAQRTPTAVVLRGSAPEGPLELEIPIEVIEQDGQTIHQLAAKKAVQELEEGRGWLTMAKDEASGKLLKQKYPGRFSDMVEREAVRLGVQFQVGGKWCSFVAREKKPAVEAEDAKPKPVEFDWVDVDSDEITISEANAERYVHATSCRRSGGGRGGRGASMSSNQTIVSTRDRCSGDIEDSRRPSTTRKRHANTSDKSANDHFSAPEPHRLSSSGLLGSAAPGGFGQQKSKKSKSGGGIFGSSVFSRSSAAPAPKGAFGSAAPYSAASSYAAPPPPSGGLFGSAAPASAPSTRSSRAMPSAPAAFSFGGPPAPPQMSAGPPRPMVAPTSFGGMSSDAGVAQDRSRGGSSGPMKGFRQRVLSREKVKERKEQPKGDASVPDADYVSKDGIIPDMDEEEGVSSEEEAGFMFEPAQEAVTHTRAEGHAAAPAKKPGKDPLIALIDLQTFQGSWKWTSELVAITSANESSAQAAAAGMSKEILATAIVIAFFETKLASSKDTWELVVEKARSWLEEQLGGSDKVNAVVKAVAGSV